MDTLSIVIIAALAIIVVVLLYKILSSATKNKKTAVKTEKKEEKKAPEKPVLQSGNLIVNTEFMQQTEIDFMNALIKSLPNFCVVMAKVPLKRIIKPAVGNFGADDVYNQVIDFCIFNQRTMTPILIADLYNVDFEKKNIDTQNRQVTDILKKAGLPTVFFQTKTAYDKEEIKKEILKSI